MNTRVHLFGHLDAFIAWGFTLAFVWGLAFEIPRHPSLEATMATVVTLSIAFHGHEILADKRSQPGFVRIGWIAWARSNCLSAFMFKSAAVALFALALLRTQA